MRNEARLNKQQVLIFGMNVLIVLMCIATIICACVAVQEIYDDYYYRSDEDSFWYQIEDSNFYRTVDFYYQNVADGFEDDKGLQEFYAVAKYYEAASCYKAYMEIGDTTRAEREYTKMDQAKEDMGSWNILHTDIDRQLKLEIQ